jgi:hypothetical protein
MPDVFSTANCFKGFSAGGSSPFFGAGFGGGRIDKECEARITALAFAALNNPTAAAKLLCSTDSAKRAGLSREECMQIERPQPIPPPAPAGFSAPPPPPPQIIVPPAQVTVNLPPLTTAVQPPPAPAPAAAAPMVAKRAKVKKPCNCSAAPAADKPATLEK